ncbi:MAG: hypothetical protein AB7F25_13470 [Deferribacterales bacterium]
MKHFFVLMFSLLLLPCTIFAGGLEDADYTTPDSWSQHLTADGFKTQAVQHGILGGSMDMSLTTRYRYLVNDYANDQNIYQYLRMRYSDAKLGSGTVSGALFFRAAHDLDGRNGEHWGENRYYYYDDILDAETDDNESASRLYQGYLKFSGVVKNTELTLGRIYVDRIDTFQLDGADAQLSFLDNKVKLFAFGGRPVSFYVDTDDDSVYGGGFELAPVNNLKLRGVFSGLDISDDKKDLQKVRADYSLNGSSVYGEYGQVDSDGYYKLGGVYRYNPTKTTLSVNYEELLDSIGKENGYYVSNPLTYTLYPYGDYKKVKVRISQGITEHVVVGVGAEYKNANGYELDNRDYKKYTAYLDLARIPSKNTYISFNVDYWDVDSTSYGKSDKSVTFGGQLTQVVSDNLDIWLGTRFERFEYDVEDDETKDWIQTHYLGCQYTLNNRISITGDVSLEKSEILERDSSDFDQNLLAEVWLNISI